MEAEDLDTMVDETTEDEAVEEFDDTAEDTAEAPEEALEEADEISEEELDTIADTAIDVLRGILQYFDAEDCAIDEYEGDDGELILDIVGNDLAVLIGRHGKTLEALQFLVSSIVNRKLGFRYPVVIDIEGYKNRRRQKLEATAKSSAARAIRQQTEIRLRPMPSYERRVVHITLRNDNRVTTESEGVDPNRYVVIKPL
jgi:spoIIIJ-associated protein